jgi:hypothetical protein
MVQLANQNDRLGGHADFNAEDGKAAPRGIVEFRAGRSVAFASRRFLDGGAGVGVGPPVGQSVSSNGAFQGGIHHATGASRSPRPRLLESVAAGGEGSSD